MGMSALPSPSEKILVGERTDTSPSEGNPNSGEVCLPPPSEGIPICGTYGCMYVCCRAILLLLLSGLSTSSGRVDGFILSADVSTAMEGCMVSRIKQYFIQKYSTWTEIRRYIPCCLLYTSPSPRDS